MAKDERQPDDEQEELNIIEEEKAQERGERDYNTIFDEDYAEHKPEEENEGIEENDNNEETETIASQSDSDTSPEEKKKSESKPKNSPSSSKSSGKNKKTVKEEKDPKVIQGEKGDDESMVQGAKEQKSGRSLTKKILAGAAVLIMFLVGIYFGNLYFQIHQVREEAASTTTTTTTMPEKTVYVTASGGLNMRKDPSSSSKSLAVIPYGTKLSVLDTQNSWDKVEYNGQTGWVSTDYVSETKPTEWKTYTGTGFSTDNPKFSIQYPSDWALDGYKVSKTDNGKLYTIALGEGGHGFAEGDTSITSSQENITVNGQAGIKTTAKKDGKIIVITATFQKGNGDVIIEFDPPAGYDQTYIDTFNKMVDTFKFL